MLTAGRWSLLQAVLKAQHLLVSNDKTTFYSPVKLVKLGAEAVLLKLLLPLRLCGWCPLT